MKVISIEQFDNKNLIVFVEAEKEYQQYSVFDNGKKNLLMSFPKERYGDYEMFWNIMGKWDIETRFYKEPVEIADEKFTFSNLLNIMKEKENE